MYLVTLVELLGSPDLRKPNSLKVNENNKQTKSFRSD